MQALIVNLFGFSPNEHVILRVNATFGASYDLWDLELENLTSRMDSIWHSFELVSSKGCTNKGKEIGGWVIYSYLPISHWIALCKPVANINFAKVCTHCISGGCQVWTFCANLATSTFAMGASLCKVDIFNRFAQGKLCANSIFHPLLASILQSWMASFFPCGRALSLIDLWEQRALCEVVRQLARHHPWFT